MFQPKKLFLKGKAGLESVLKIRIRSLESIVFLVFTHKSTKRPVWMLYKLPRLWYNRFLNGHFPETGLQACFRQGNHPPAPEKADEILI